MTTALFTLADRWPFQAGEAVYYLPSGHSHIYPMPLIRAIVLSCRQWRSSPHATVTIRRDDRQRTSSVKGSSLVYRGFCAACEVPAIEGTHGALICPQCQELATALPPPDHLVVRWYPHDRWTWPITMRRQVEHPDWAWDRARDVATTPHEEAYEDMLKQLRLRRLYHSSDYERPSDESRYDWQLLKTMEAAAILRDDALFLATHQELSARQAGVSRSKYLAQRLQRLSPERLEMLLDLASDSDEPPPPAAPGAVSLIPLPEPESDTQPDGADETTRWLEQQFKKKRAA